jgi:multiple sugar transport system substrate-binding protein
MHNMSSKVRVFFVLTVTLIALSLAANVMIFRAPAATAQGSGEIRVTTWDSGDGLAPWNNAIAAFQEAYPDITVKFEPVPQDYGTKLLANMAAGTAADVYQVGDGDVAKFVDQGIVEPLDSYISGPDGFDLNTTFFPAVAAFGQVGGQTYLLTKDYSPLVLYYNKDMFDNAGVAYPTADWTWDDLLSAAQTLTTSDHWGIQLPDGWGDWLWDRGIVPVIAENGDLFLKYKVAPTKADVDSFSGADLFTSGKVAMLWTGRWPLAGYKAIDGFNFGTMGLPAGPVGKGNTLCWAGFAINSASQNKDAAWTFLKFIAAGDGAKAFADYAFTAVQSIAESQGLTTDPYDGPIVADVANAVPIPDSYSPYYGECVATPFKAHLEEVFLKGVTVQDAMDAAAQEAQTCLDSK